MTLREHIEGHTLTLMRAMASQITKSAGDNDAEAIHDLRVSIRRLRECLRTFKDLFPPAPRKKIRKQLRQLMKAAERVRSADIALKLLAKAGLGDNAPQVQDLRKQRDQFQVELHDKLSAFAKQPYTRTWREALGI